jgi:L-ascorbate metabolism protein UlaG (beta-lactamase superfamily)
MAGWWNSVMLQLLPEGSPKIASNAATGRPYHSLISKLLTRFRIYISGDTLMLDELKKIPEQYKGQNIDLMLIHLGGTTIPSPSVPLLMVTMDAKQGLELVRLINPDLTIPIHYEYVAVVQIEIRNAHSCLQ